jgi:alpha-galactosidase
MRSEPRPPWQLPPLGWRSWNLYGGNVDQSKIESIMEGMVRKNPRYTVDGVPTSLCDLGYCDVGLDDNWQQCGAPSLRCRRA